MVKLSPGNSFNINGIPSNGMILSKLQSENIEYSQEKEEHVLKMKKKDLELSDIKFSKELLSESISALEFKNSSNVIVTKFNTRKIKN